MPDRIRLHADEQVARSIIRGLRARGIDVSTTPEAGLRGCNDVDQLRHARRSGRVVLTRDADFLRMHDAGERHAGIVFAAQGRSIGDVIRGVVLIAELLSDEDMQDHVEFI